MKRHFTLAVLGAVLSPLAPAALAGAAAAQDVVQDVKPAEHRWFADYDMAVAAAKAEGKDLLVDFTGSDWCGWCIKLHEEVFQHAAFYDEASKHYVLLALDFPNGDEAKAKVPNPERNKELSEKYEIGGFPTILLMNVNGEVFGKTGYRDGGPEKYIAYLADLSKSGKALVAAGARLSAAYDAATDKVAVVREALGLLGGAVEGAAGADAVAAVARKGYELDPKNESGLKLAVLEALMKAGIGEAADLDLADELDPKNEAGLLEKALMQRANGVSDDTTANAFVDKVLAFAKLGKVHDKDALKEYVHRATFWAHAYLSRADDAQTLLAFAGTLGEVPQELLDALKG
ncbi:MAG: thioredoxin family protein [Planctomycetota bacterium]